MIANFPDTNANQSFDSGTDTLLSDFDYTLQADGRRTGVTEVNDLGQTTVIEWTYDDMGRLVRESYDSHNNTLDFIADYVFDLVGNRIEKLTDTDPTFSGTPTFDELIDYTFDANDRLVTETLDAPGTTDDRHTVYDYDRTQQTHKVVYQGLSSSGTKLEQTDNSYDLQGRLSQVEIDSNGDGTVDSTISYEYDTDGVRVAKDENGQVLFYLADKENFTGYAQTIEERDGSGDLVKSYTIGLDVLSQYDAVAAVVHYLVTDGHGSVRGLTDALGAIVSGQRFGFDAYGNAVGFDPSTALTSLLYSGEFFDTAIQQQYLRARWYDATTGRFNRLDPFFGNLSDPQSLHKYLYVHGDPVNGIDPSGLFSLASRGAVIGITSGLSALSGLAIFQSAGRNPIRGAVLGGLGGLALSLAFFSGRLPRVAGEAMGALAIVTASSLLRDEVARLYGVGGRRSVASLAADGFEAFMFGAFNAEASIGIGGIDELYESSFYDETGVHFLQAFSTFTLSAGAAFLSVSGSLLRGLQLRLTTSQQDMGAAKAGFRAVLKEELVNLVKVFDAKNGPSPLGNALNALAAVSTTRLGKLPLVRNLPPRLRLLLQQNMNEVVIMTGVQFLDQQFGFQLQERINEGARQVGDQIVDLIFD